MYVIFDAMAKTVNKKGIDNFFFTLVRHARAHLHFTNRN